MQSNTDQFKQLRQRRQFFAADFSAIPCCLGEPEDKAAKLNTCPACGYPTLRERAAYEICAICRWEDDGQDDLVADEVWGGPNGSLSLTEYRLKVANKLTELLADAGTYNVREVEIQQELNKLQILLANYQPGMQEDVQQQVSVVAHTLGRLQSWKKIQ